MKVIQFIFFLIGPIIVWLLFRMPSAGLFVFWKVLIPIAPIIFFLLPGIWRNICPLATTSLLPTKFKFSKRIKVSQSLNDKFKYIAIILLFSLAPARHLGIDSSGEKTAILLLGTAVIAFILGIFFENKSAWCYGLCPVYPVEQLYGEKPLMTFENIQCHECNGCVSKCPDSCDDNQNSSLKTILYGSFPGFILGWFNTPQLSNQNWTSSFATIYAYSLIPAIISFCIYLLIKRSLKQDHLKTLQQTSLSISLILYYHFQITNLIPNKYTMIIKFLIITLIFILSYKLRKKAWNIKPIKKAV